MGLFKRRHVPSGVSEPGFRHQNEHALLPTQVDTNDTTYPEEPGISNSPESWRSNVGVRLFQGDQGTPDSFGTYVLHFQSDMGLVQGTNNYLAPVPGSQDLNVPRDIGGVPGMNRILQSVGPVRGETYDVYQNARARISPQQAGQYGPVVGGGDYAQQLANAYYSQANAVFDQASAESAMVASV